MATITARNIRGYLSIVVMVFVTSTCQPPEFPKPKIISIDPKEAMPKSTISIKGEVLSSVTQVLFGDIGTTQFWMDDTDKAIMEVAVPEQTVAGIVEVRLKSPQGDSAPYTITVLPLLPRILRIEPLSARIGETVTVIGENLTSDTKVIFPNGAQVDGSLISSAALTVKIPDGEVSGVVKLSNQLGTSVDDYHYEIIDPTSSKPSVSRIDPPEPFVGETITVEGTNFIQDKTTVSLLGKQLSTPGEFSIVSTTQMKVVLPAWATSGPLVIDNTFGSFTTALTIQSMPAVERILPKANGRGGPLIIYGTNLKSVEQILVGSGKILKPQFTYIKDNAGRDVLYGSVPAVSAGKTKVKVGNLRGIVSEGFSYTVEQGTVPLPNGFTSITYPNVLVPSTLITMSNSWGRNVGAERWTLAEGEVIGNGLKAIRNPQNEAEILGYYSEDGGLISLRIDTTLYEGRLDEKYGKGGPPFRIVLTPVWSGAQRELIYPFGLDDANPSQLLKGGQTILTGKYFYENEGTIVMLDDVAIPDAFIQPDPPNFEWVSPTQLKLTIPADAPKGVRRVWLKRGDSTDPNDFSNSINVTVTN